MAVALDAVSSAATFSAAGVSLTDHANLTVGASLSNGALIFGAAFDSNSLTTVTAHWDSAGTNQLMTQLGVKTYAGSIGSVYLFGLRAPTSGAKNLHLTWTGTAQVALFGISFTGVDQTSDAIAFPNLNSAGANSAAPSVTITSAVGDAVVAWFSCDAGVTLSAPNNIQLYLDGAGAHNTNSAANRAAGAASVVMSATISVASDWAAIGVDIAAAAGAAAFVPYNPWPQAAPILAQ